ncbi:phage baseplate assembly protein V [Kistimonas asteriae]|uniref:phage baseplate assembly protein V n=1 Tax=Kistimonas asteriae TaxID=517724 RepID=UPI001BADC15A|nr:phage baseplate assembly protein V [Kistimonas asteriae]
MSQAANIAFKADGKDLSRELKFISLTTRYECHCIPEATVVVSDGNPADGKYPASELAQLAPGKTVEIALSYMGKKAEESVVFSGLITGQQIQVSRGSSRLVLQLHGDLIKLVEPRLTQVFKEKSKDGDLIKTLLKDGGVKFEDKHIAKTEVEHTQLAIFDESAWSFIKYRAEANGLVLMPVVNSVVVNEPGKVEGKSHAFKIDHFIDANLKLDDTSALDKVSATAWSVKEQKDASPVKGAVPAIGGGSETAQLAAKAMARSEWVAVSDVPAAEAASAAKELKGWVAGELLYRELDRYQGSLVMNGTGDINPGDKLKLEDFGKVFQGEYLVTGIRHEVDQQGWRTTVRIGIPITRTAFFQGLHKRRAAVRGLLVGQVQPYKEDPNKLFRLPVKVPTFGSKDNIVWARPASPYASNEVGLFLPPKPNDEVVLGWFGNSPSEPVILGAVHNPKNKPPGVYDEKMEQRGLVVSKDALTLMFDEKEKTLTLSASKDTNQVLAEKDGMAITVAEKKINVGKEMVIESDKDITLKAGAKLILKPGADAVIEAGGKCQVTASKTEIQ